MPRYLLPLLIIASIFQAASILNFSISGFVIGIVPYYFVAVLIAIKMIVVILSGRMRMAPMRWVRWHHFLLSFFVLYAVFTALVYPHLFHGIGVYIPRGGIGLIHLSVQPLSWSFSNLAQAGYLILNFLVLLYAAHTMRSERSVQDLVSALYIAGGIVTFFAIYERISFLAGLPYPYEILNSNPARSQGYDTMTAGVLRISSTFTEASHAARFLVSFLTFMLLIHIKGYGSPRHALGIVAVAAALLATTSTTGYAGLAMVALLLYFAYIVAPFLRARVNPHMMALSALGVLGAALALILTPGVSGVLEQVILTKLLSGSYMMRIGSDIYALELTTLTHGLGVGLGSNRPSSFLTYLLSNIGIFGLAFFSILLFVLYKATSESRHRLGSRSRHSSVLLAFWWALIAVIASKMITGPDLSTSYLWIWWLAILGAISASRLPEYSDQIGLSGEPQKVRGSHAGEIT